MPKIDKKNVPKKYHELIPHVERLGIFNDVERESIFRNLSEAEKEVQVALYKKYDVLLDAWLAGPESNRPEVSDEYIAFTMWRMETDYIAD